MNSIDLYWLITKETEYIRLSLPQGLSDTSVIVVSISLFRWSCIRIIITALQFISPQHSLKGKGILLFCHLYHFTASQIWVTRHCRIVTRSYYDYPQESWYPISDGLGKCRAKAMTTRHSRTLQVHNLHSKSFGLCILCVWFDEFL